MTGKNKNVSLSVLLSSITQSSMHVEIKKSSRGAIAVISGIVSVVEYTDHSVEILSHSGRVNLFGENIRISVLEGRAIEIYGRITEVKLSYGKSR